MRRPPEPVGTPPDTRSPDRFLLWGAGRQWTTLLSTSTVNGLYTLCGVLSATALGAALDSGLADGDTGTLLLWSGVLAACAPASAVIVLAARAREYSSGRQQHLRLARALAADPEVLVLVEPASAVDAHSEAAVARRLPAARSGRTTVLITTRPLLLGRTDRVHLVSGGRVVAGGTHQDLLATAPDYTRTVLRTASEEP